MGMHGDVTNCLGTLKRSFPPNGEVHSGDPAEGAAVRSTIRPPSLKTGHEDFDDGVYEDCHELSYNRSPFIDDDGSDSGLTGDEEPEDPAVPQPVNSPNEEGTASEDEDDDLIVVPGIL
ncbi:uncharacterized protein A4U43_C01F32260 [Asparagus officinalis]|uniref:Uncharacterized protein n=1 Tax=Asparagus officinalis TaxID=4686 RepID=A0A5P1FTT8_ASPOF|nr:uncharacterized protein A4U43_C01F32260 [Asparagus officinalis]